MNSERINELSKDIYRQNVSVGWWDDPDRCLTTAIQLANTEVCEATEGARRGLYDEHLPERKMEEVEMADTLIRILDFGAKLNLSYQEVPGEMGYLQLVRKAKNLPSHHLVLCSCISSLGVTIMCHLSDDYVMSGALPRQYSELIQLILMISEIYNYDLEGAVLEKIEYNKTRQDHTRESRASEGGKAF